jgi:hypothetical protein
MPHQDQGLGQDISVNHRSLREAIDWLLSREVFSNISFRKGCRWTPLTLVATALLWAWGSSKNVTERFRAARKITRKAFRLQGDLPSYQAFMKILRKWSCELLLAVMPHFQLRMEQELPDHFRVAGLVVMAVDGSRVELPRTQSNQDQFSAGRKIRGRTSKRRTATTQVATNQKVAPRTAKKKASPKKSAKKQQAERRRAAKKQRAAQKRTAKKKAATAKKSSRSSNDNPQMWLTMMWHVGTGLPWDWRSGPADSSEREHLLSMIHGLPGNCLVTADAGFVGYEYWKALIDSGRHFVIRVGANVRLLNDLGYVRRHKDIVYLWPEAAAKKKLEPLVLRLTQFQTTKQTVYIVTNILDEKHLSDAQMVEIYKRRWGVEVLFRSFKQTFDRHKLCCHRAENAAVEMDWSLVGLWAVCLLGLKALLDAGQNLTRLSVAGVLRAVRQTMHEYKSKPDEGEDLWSLLAISVIDSYERQSKASRDYPRRKKKKPPVGIPEIIDATPEQAALARQIKKERQEARNVATAA